MTGGAPGLRCDVGRMWITWKDRDADLAWPITIERKIDIFYEQVRGWQSHVADLIANGGLVDEFFCPLQPLGI
jgi:hypothetical protein